MKVKELKKTVNVSWSPAELYPVMLAAGSAAQQVDDTFSSTSVLELYSLNLADAGQDLELKSSLQTQHKFQKLAWSGAGIIVGGCDGGLLEFYNADRLLKNASDALVASSTKHSGHVSTLDINPYQKNLLASGASDSEIFIWDLNNTTQPMAPGNRSQPYEHVQGVAWNRQVQHILGSTFPTRCVVWDLRKNEPIMKLSDSQSRSKWRSLAWHPAVATQLCVASEDDQNPVIQLWDLRLAASPLLTLEGHTKGVMSLSWCEQDPDILLSAGKDGRVLCWNPNDNTPGGCGAVEVGSEDSWVVELALCPRAPGVLVAAGPPQRTVVLSLLGGAVSAPASLQSQSVLLDAFGGGLGALPAAPRPAPPRPQPPRAPAWMRRPAAASFAFGGKLVTFEKCQEPNTPKQVFISQVVSDPEIIEKCTELDAVLNMALSQDPNAIEALAEYCREKGDAATDQNDRFAWFFLRANFLHSFRSELLNLLGFKQDEIQSKLKPNAAADATTNNVAGLSRGESTETEAELSTDTSTDLSDAQTLIEKKLANVDLDSTVKDVVIPDGEDSTSMICRALVCGRIEEAVDLCLEADRMSDALVIASLGGESLVRLVQRRWLSGSASPVRVLAGALLARSWPRLLASCGAASWRHVLATLATAADDASFISCAESLGDRLSSQADTTLSRSALLCYVASGAADRAAAAWRGRGTAGAERGGQGGDAYKAVLLRRAAAVRGTAVQPGGPLESILIQEALSVASQGCLHSALSLLAGVQADALTQRLKVATGQTNVTQAALRPRTSSAHSRRGHYAHDDAGYNNAPMPPTSSYDQWQQQPPRPSSQGSHTGGPTSRSKYKVDPSVAAPTYNSYNYNNPIPPQPQPQFGYSPLSDQYSNASVPSPGYGSSMNQINAPLMKPPINSPPLNPMNAPINPMNPPVNPMNAPINPMNPPINPMNGGYYNPPVEAAAAALPTKPAPPGWNDPPMMSSKPKAKQEVQSQAPITHPLFGVEPPQHVPLNPYPGQTQQYPGQGQQYPGQGQQYPGQGQQYPSQAQQYPGQNQQYPGQNQQYPGQNQTFPGQNQLPGQNQQFPGQGQNYPSQMLNYPGQFDQQQQCNSPAPPEPPAPAPKAAIPEQHLVLQTTFDSLKNECASRANNPQMKRKLEDVQRRLETLYDMLRENKLSESALSTLHSCASLSAAGSPAAAAAAASSLAAGGDFAAVAAFLPGLKVLFQLAENLQVYVR